MLLRRYAYRQTRYFEANLGDYYRRLRTRLSAPKAITATAHKLARIIYFLIKNRKPFDETVFAEQERKYQERMKKRFINRAKSLGLQLVTD